MWLLSVCTIARTPPWEQIARASKRLIGTLKNASSLQTLALAPDVYLRAGKSVFAVRKSYCVVIGERGSGRGYVHGEASADVGSDGLEERHYEVTWSDGATVTAVLHALYCTPASGEPVHPPVYISPSYVQTSVFQ